jgi:hypothetical protein
MSESSIISNLPPTSADGIRELIQAYADSSAASPEMWGGRTPTNEQARQLSDCFIYAWEEAVEQMLRHWTTPPTTTGY